MKKITTVLSLVLSIVLFTSCEQKSLQSYLVKAQEKQGFMTVDLPTSFIQLKDGDVPADVKATVESIKKINAVALPFQGNEDAYETEKNEIKGILKDSNKYKSIMSMKMKGVNMKVYYTGEADAIDEVIVFGYSKAYGLGIARLLGDNMNPAQIMNMMNNIKFDPTNLNLSNLNLAFD